MFEDFLKKNTQDFKSKVLNFQSYIYPVNIKLINMSGDVIYDGKLCWDLLNYFNLEYHRNLIAYTRDPDAVQCANLDTDKISLNKVIFFIVNTTKYNTLEEAIANLDWNISNTITLLTTSKNIVYNYILGSSISILPIQFLQNYYNFIQIKFINVNYETYLDDVFDESIIYTYPEILIPDDIEIYEKDGIKTVKNRHNYYY